MEFSGGIYKIYRYRQHNIVFAHAREICRRDRNYTAIVMKWLGRNLHEKRERDGSGCAGWDGIRWERGIGWGGLEDSRRCAWVPEVWVKELGLDGGIDKNRIWEGGYGFVFGSMWFWLEFLRWCWGLEYPWGSIWVQVPGRDGEGLKYLRTTMPCELVQRWKPIPSAFLTCRECESSTKYGDQILHYMRKMEQIRKMAYF